MEPLQGKIIAVTGAASGMGRASATDLSKKGAILSLADRDRAGLEHTVSLLEGTHRDKTIINVLDVASTSEVCAWITDTVARLGPLDGAANVAGVYQEKSILECDEDEWDFTMDINAKGIFNCLKAQIPNIKDGGSIVNIASTSGIRANRAAPVYSASKHAVVGLTKSVARDVAHRSVRINAIAPGFVATPMVKVHLTPERISQTSLASRPADPLEIARVVSFLLGDDASFVTAAVWPVDAGHSAGP